jgi:hypothetical protein
MSKELAVALIGLLGVALTAALTAIATAAKVRRDLESEYDIALRNERTAAYRELWRKLEPLAKYFRRETLTYRGVEELGSELRKWYFETGGIYLTSRSRDAYFDLLDELRDRVAFRRGSRGAKLDFEEFERLRTLGSDLRTVLVQDVRTRRQSALEEV